MNFMLKDFFSTTASDVRDPNIKYKRVPRTQLNEMSSKFLIVTKVMVKITRDAILPQMH